MAQFFFNTFRHIDWLLFSASILLVASGLVTMNVFNEPNIFFQKQLLWLIIGIIAFFIASISRVSFLKHTTIIVAFFITSVFLFILLFFIEPIQGARSWLSFGPILFQPVDPSKIVLIILLSKYFSRRHIEIANIRHILVSGAYALVFFLLILIQPDFGSAIIIFLIWLGMVLVSGISKKHLALIFIAGIIAFSGLWQFGFEPYQKERVLSFLHPLADIEGAGYNARQSKIAVGSGEIFGKGIGYGTQSRLKFLPEYQTDFIFAAFAEEWGFAGTVSLFVLFSIVIWRILAAAMSGASNFEMFFGIGVAIYLMSHFTIHIGINIGLLPVTGTPLPFLSYGGSHLITEFTALGILMGMRRYSRPAHRNVAEQEIIGV